MAGRQSFWTNSRGGLFRTLLVSARSPEERQCGMTLRLRLWGGALLLNKPHPPTPGPCPAIQVDKERTSCADLAAVRAGEGGGGGVGGGSPGSSVLVWGAECTEMWVGLRLDNLEEAGEHVDPQRGPPHSLHPRLKLAAERTPGRPSRQQRSFLLLAKAWKL